MKRKEGSMYMGRYAGYFVWVLPVLFGMVFLLTSCDNEEIPEKGKKGGKLIPVSVRIAGITEGGTEEMTRSSGREEEAITETVAIGDGLLLEMRLEEDPASRLRATAPLGNGKKFRVIAINSSDKKYVSYGDFTVGGVNTLSTFSVQSGSTYDFICVSLNSESDLPATNGLAAGSIPSFTASGADGADLLYGSLTNQTIALGNEDVELSFTLSHKFSKVTLVADCSYNGWNITAVPGNVRLAPFYAVSMNYAGIVTKQGNAITTAYFTWDPVTTPGPTVTSNAYTMFTAGEAISVEIAANAFTINGNGTPSFQTTAIFNDKTLEAGKHYTLTLKFKTPKFASSNIYWDGSKLTFAEYSTDPSSVKDVNGIEMYKYQGVYFYFGSLIGIAPMDIIFSGSTTLLYVPPTGGSDSWYITSADGTLSALPTGISGTIKNHITVEAGVWTGMNYAAIPRVRDGTPASPYSRDGRYVIDLPADSLAEFKGDICKYIDPAYRLPTSNEFSTYGNNINWNTTSTQYGWKRVDSPTNAWVTSNVDENPAGTRTSIGSGGAFGPSENFFPASGTRQTLNSAMSFRGMYGFYWSGSVCDASNGNVLFFGSGYASSLVYSPFGTGCSVRCIMQ
ncbi:MAG: hypothetical protein LBS46_01050 [Dysgonamonadaceae bacterium]|jgi:hypothetical protein|nr:hypothetical protein [Dysgonamonadaceae bacterium]